ncbi:MAG: hypothetical protein HWQ41_19170 [Nostoc sp. NOS(2021)]|nr:hypothetical protein [Nostoc sp. NOS(2021)]
MELDDIDYLDQALIFHSVMELLTFFVVTWVKRSRVSYCRAVVNGVVKYLLLANNINVGFCFALPNLQNIIGIIEKLI